MRKRLDKIYKRTYGASGGGESKKRWISTSWFTSIDERGEFENDDSDRGGEAEEEERRLLKYFDARRARLYGDGLDIMAVARKETKPRSANILYFSLRFTRQFWTFILTNTRLSSWIVHLHSENHQKQINSKSQAQCQRQDKSINPMTSLHSI